MWEITCLLPVARQILKLGHIMQGESLTRDVLEGRLDGKKPKIQEENANDG